MCGSAIAGYLWPREPVQVFRLPRMARKLCGNDGVSVFLPRGVSAASLAQLLAAAFGDEWSSAKSGVVLETAVTKCQKSSAGDGCARASLLSTQAI